MYYYSWAYHAVKLHDILSITKQCKSFQCCLKVTNQSVQYAEIKEMNELSTITLTGDTSSKIIIVHGEL